MKCDIRKSIITTLLLMSSLTDAFFGFEKQNEAQLAIVNHAHLHQPETDSLMTRIIIQQLKNEDVFNSIEQSIESQKSMPTCNKQAYLSLVRSCQQSGHTTDADLSLDGIKSTFAAHLAVCGLLDVGLDKVPVECKYLIDHPTQHDTDSKDSRQLQACLQGMYQDPNAWTTFDNAKQNALAICHSMRVHVEKDQVIEQYRTFADIARNVSETSWTSTREMVEVQNRILSAARSLFDELKSTRSDQVETQARIAHELDTFAKLCQQLQEVIQQSVRDADTAASYSQQSADVLLHNQLALKESHEIALQSIKTSHLDVTTLQQEVVAVVEILSQAGLLHNELKLRMQRSSVELASYFANQSQLVTSMMQSQDELQQKILQTGTMVDDHAESVVKRLSEISEVAEAISANFATIESAWPWVRRMFWIVLAWCVVSLLKIVVCAVLGILGGAQDLVQRYKTERRLQEYA